ncbi:MAG: methionine--tRNA ligase [Candidatus Levybacteria bacterium]|nr:methionine--tRNA ligase [Candidatus Levybacteria bacterium]
MGKFYLTSAIPYVNAKPHIGHALEFIQADTIVRFRKITGDNVFYLCGSDENALKNVQAAEQEGKPVQAFVDENAKLFEALAKKLNVEFDVFQKGSDPKHHASSQKLWQLCEKTGDIYKKTYKGLYCVGCEAFYTKSELNENGECFEHPGKKLEEVEEENYFFKLSKYQNDLIKIIESNEYEIVPEFRKNEILSFIKSGLQDFSISRSNTRAKNWGVPVPNDPTQRIYVWFDALNIYQSGIGFGSAEQNDIESYKKWWPADLHVIGKGIIRFHAIYWPAILLSAGLALPKKLFVHEYFTVNGQKMSKTLGNVIDPIEIVNKYGADALRYYCLAKISPFADGDFSEEKLKEAYNADLANGLGNLVSRVAKLCETAKFEQMISASKESVHLIHAEEYSQAFSEFRFNDATSVVWKKIALLDKFINDEKPWVLLKTNDQRLKSILAHCVDQIQEIAALLEPFLPETAKKIEEQFRGAKIVSQKPLFPRI